MREIQRLYAELREQNLADDSHDQHITKLAFLCGTQGGLKKAPEYLFIKRSHRAFPLTYKLFLAALRNELRRLKRQQKAAEKKQKQTGGEPTP